ncbi:MAG: ATP-binding protein [Armatimonadota bacterium]
MIGLHKAKRILSKLESSASGVHAVLLYGPEGSGKGLMATSLIEHWLGNQRAIDAFRRGANPDVHVIEPMGASRIIRRHQITPPTPPNEPPVAHLVDFLRTAPLYSNNKVAKIVDAERMNDTATNALLKPLEEPASYAKLILTTTSISQIRQTILSRCLVVACELPSDEELKKAFPEATPEFITMAGASPGQLSRIAGNPEFYQKVSQFARQLVNADASQLLKLSDGFKSLAEELDSSTKIGARAANTKVVELVATMIAQQSPERADIIQALSDAHRRIIGNAASNLVFDAVLARFLIK